MNSTLKAKYVKLLRYTPQSFDQFEVYLHISAYRDKGVIYEKCSKMILKNTYLKLSFCYSTIVARHLIITYL